MNPATKALDFLEAENARQRLVELAWYLGGLNDAWCYVGLPEWIDFDEFTRHVQTAQEVRSGGTYRGPLVLWQMAAYVDRLLGELERRSAAANHHG